LRLSKKWILYVLAALVIIVYLVIVSEQAFKSGIKWAW
jgi:hypothetical protein